jgi:hypothetical protein
MLVQENCHIFYFALPENVHPNAIDILVFELYFGLNVVGLEQVDDQIQPKRWLAPFVSHYLGAPLAEKVEGFAGRHPVVDC